MMLDVDTLRQAYEKTHGKEKFTRMEVCEMVLQACTPVLREAWCKVFGLEEADRAWAMSQPYPEAPRGRRQQSADEAQQARRMAVATDYRIGAWNETDLRVMLDDLVAYWCRELPARLRRQSLPLCRKAAIPRDVEAWARGILPWMQSATPRQPTNLRPIERLSSGCQWWRGVADAVYANDYCNGTVPNHPGVSLEWLAEPVKDDSGRLWPTLRLQRVLEGWYSLSDEDQAAVAASRPVEVA